MDAPTAPRSEANSMNPIHAFRLTLLAIAIWREARGEPNEGKIAVGEVIRNRVDDSRWPDTWEDVILQPWQFSAFNKGDPNATKFPDPTTRAWLDCYAAACSVYEIGPEKGYANGANHYCAVSVHPSWARTDKLVAQIGRHKFYKL